MLYGSGIATAASIGSCYYMFPDIREHPQELFLASMRSWRCLYYSAKIAKLYYSNEINDEMHYKAARLLFECFAKNAGTYIKLGQMVG